MHELHLWRNSVCPTGTFFGSLDPYGWLASLRTLLETTGAAMKRFLVTGWRGYRRWPLWAQVVAVIFAFPLLSAALQDDSVDVQQVALAGQVPIEDQLPRASTTTEATLELTTTTTTALTTTTLPPTTAAPLRTAVPPTTAVSTTTVPRPTTEATPVSTTEAPTAAASGCHPSYEGACLPTDASDVDCSGGTGNGPAYVSEKSFRVVGPDVYGLDHDSNGFACES